MRVARRGGLGSGHWLGLFVSRAYCFMLVFYSALLSDVMAALICRLPFCSRLFSPQEEDDLVGLCMRGRGWHFS